MARIVVVVLLLSLALAPAAEAAAPGRGEPPTTGWFDALRGNLDRLFSWLPTIRSAPRKNGASIIPNGIAAPPPAPARGAAAPGDLRSVAQQSGATIVPNGITARPPVPDRGRYLVPRSERKPGQRHGAHILPAVETLRPAGCVI